MPRATWAAACRGPCQVLSLTPGHSEGLCVHKDSRERAAGPGETPIGPWGRSPRGRHCVSACSEPRGRWSSEREGSSRGVLPSSALVSRTRHVTTCQLTPETKQVGFRCHALNQERRESMPTTAWHGCQEPGPRRRRVPVLCGVGRAVRPALLASTTGEPLKAWWPFRRRAGEPGSQLQEGCALQCHHD